MTVMAAVGVPVVAWRELPALPIRQL